MTETKENKTMSAQDVRGSLRSLSVAGEDVGLAAVSEKFKGMVTEFGGHCKSFMDKWHLVEAPIRTAVARALDLGELETAMAVQQPANAVGSLGMNATVVQESSERGMPVRQNQAEIA